MNKTIAFYVVIIIVLASLAFITIYLAMHGKEQSAIFSGFWLTTFGGSSLWYLYEQRY